MATNKAPPKSHARLGRAMNEKCIGTVSLRLFFHTHKWKVGEQRRYGLPMGLLMARCAEGDQILSSVIAQSASWQNVMDLKILHAPAPLASPAISLQDFTAELAISLRVKP